MRRFKPGRIELRKGGRAQSAAMVAACHQAGVKVIVDAVVNHMANEDKSGPGWAGARWSHDDYPGTYQIQDFHHCGRNGNDDIVDYYDRYEVQNCELANLADRRRRRPVPRQHCRARRGGTPHRRQDLLVLRQRGFRRRQHGRTGAALVPPAVRQHLGRRHLTAGVRNRSGLDLGNHPPGCPESTVGCNAGRGAWADQRPSR